MSESESLLKTLGQGISRLAEKLGIDGVLAVPSPDRAQIEQIRAFVADDILQKRLGFASAVAERLALELVCDGDDPAEAEKRTQVPVSPADLERAQAAVVGIDVSYEQGEATAAWKRSITVYLRNEQDSLKKIAQEVDLQWTDLPNAVRTAHIQQEMRQQRFLLYGGDKQLS